MFVVKVQLIAICLIVSCSSLLLAQQIPLVVQERAGIARSTEPVTVGVPFAKGALAAGVPVRILDPNGNPVNAQFKTMAVWDDGSIKWLKCDFQATVPANSVAQYNLEPNASFTTTTELVT